MFRQVLVVRFFIFVRKRVCVLGEEKTLHAALKYLPLPHEKIVISLSLNPIFVYVFDVVFGPGYLDLASMHTKANQVSLDLLRNSAPVLACTRRTSNLSSMKGLDLFQCFGTVFFVCFLPPSARGMRTNGGVICRI
jgi:hypothetical protein